MPANYKFFPCQIDGDVAFVYVDVAAHDRIARLPGVLMKLKVFYKAPRSNGLPSSAEFDAVRAIEVRIERFSRTPDRYVGRITRSGFREFYVYTRRGKTAWKAFAAKLSEESGYAMKLRLGADKSHSAYLRELYPSPEAWQVISDIDVITRLQKEGDLEGRRRRIDHWSYFDHAGAARRFTSWAAKNGFKQEPRLSGIEDDGKHCVRLYHVGTTIQRELSWHTQQLHRKAEELGGSYDGWETKVVKRKPRGPKKKS
jgi:hypothetical protein